MMHRNGCVPEQVAHLEVFLQVNNHLTPVWLSGACLSPGIMTINRKIKLCAYFICTQQRAGVIPQNTKFPKATVLRPSELFLRWDYKITKTAKIVNNNLLLNQHSDQLRVLESPAGNFPKRVWNRK